MRIMTMVVAVLLAVGAEAAEIVPFQFDESIKSEDRDRASHIVEAHKEFPNAAGSMEAARLAILRSLTGKAGKIWFLEAEGPNYADVRIDSKGNPFWVRIVYSGEFIQLQYLDGNEGFKCKLVKGTACYDNHRHYYGFTTRLRAQVQRNLGRICQCRPPRKTA